MPDILIRGLSEQVKVKLAVRAAEHGCSQQAEAKRIIEEAVSPESKNWITMLREGAESVGGIDLPIAQRHTPRITGVEL